jgi:hypothetical protein
MAGVRGIGSRLVRRGAALAVAVVVAGCTGVPEERSGGPEAPASASASASEVEPAPGAEPAPTRVVGATLRHLADVPEPITASIVFGRDGTWWHWDGAQATEWRDGKAKAERLDATALLAARPRSAVDRPLVIGSTIVTATGMRPLPEPLIGRIVSADAPWGYHHTDTSISADGTLMLVTEKWQPSRCCRDQAPDPDPPPPSHRGLLYDTATGARTELPHVVRGSVLGRDRLVLAGADGSLYDRALLHPLDSPLELRYGGQALALGVGETVLARTVLAAASGARLALHRTRDGAPLHEWDGPPGAAALAFHPVHPLLAVAGSDRLELWRVDLETPVRVAEAPIHAAPEAILFHPDGARLLLAGTSGASFELSFETEPIGGEASTPLDVALLRDHPAIPPLHAGSDVIALGFDEDHVHAYGRTHGLYAFDRADGRRVRSWHRRTDDADGVAFAARAPIVAIAERLPLRDEERRTRKLDVIDARTHATLATAFLPSGELAHLALSPRGTALAWSLEKHPWVTLRAVSGGATLLELSADTNDVAAIAISDDDRRLAVANRHITDNVRVGTVGEATPQVITTPRGVSRLVFSRDGERLFVMDFDGKIHVVDLLQGKRVASFEPTTDGPGDLVETPDGRHLAIARAGAVVLDAKTGAEVARFPVATAWVRTIAAAPDGRGLAIGDDHGVVHLFTLP